MNELPFVPEELVAHLERLYPDRMPDGEVSLTLTSRMQGRVDVVRALREMANRQYERQVQPISKGEMNNVLRRLTRPAAEIGRAHV